MIKKDKKTLVEYTMQEDTFGLVPFIKYFLQYAITYQHAGVENGRVVQDDVETISKRLIYIIDIFASKLNQKLDVKYNKTQKAQA